jgi:hypothetical protein
MSGARRLLLVLCVGVAAVAVVNLLRLHHLQEDAFNTLDPALRDEGSLKFARRLKDAGLCAFLP